MPIQASTDLDCKDSRGRRPLSLSQERFSQRLFWEPQDPKAYTSEVKYVAESTQRGPRFSDGQAIGAGGISLSLKASVCEVEQSHRLC